MKETKYYCDPHLNPLESLYDTIVFDSLDYGSHKRVAWIYGIVVGWDDESLDEFEGMNFWNSKESKRLKYLHKEFKKLKRRHDTIRELEVAEK